MPASLPAPARFPARRRPLPSGGAGAVKAASAPSVARTALTEGARRAARLSFRLAGLGFPGSWAPPGGRTGALAPPAASASRVGCAAGARGRGRRRVGGGQQSEMGAARRERKPRGVCGWSPSTATFLTRSAGAERPGRGVGAPSPHDQAMPGSPAAAGAVQRRRLTSRCTDRSAGRGADRRTFTTI
jgi:hypothetical protein